MNILACNGELAMSFRYGNVEIEDTFAELFSMWVGRILITADNEKWALAAAQSATGFASSIIMSPAEAGIERIVPSEDTPDKRVGVLIQIYNRTSRDLKGQMLARIGQCILTCPTTAVFDGLPESPRKIGIGRSIRLFGDGYQKKDVLYGREVWRIPVMEGEFIIEEQFGIAEAVAGGNFIVMAKSRGAGLEAAEKAIETIKRNVKGVVMPFPGGICRAGSKVGSRKYKLGASTNDAYCPKLRGLTESRLPPEVQSVYEIVINGLNLDVVKDAMREGIKAASTVDGVVKISSVNFGGKLGPFKIGLRELLES